MKSWLVILAVPVVAACAHDPTDSTSLSRGDRLPPRVIGLDSLRAVNGSTLPCCGIAGGALTFYYPTNPTVFVATPDGMAPKECVIGVPNGELLNPRKGVAVSMEGDTIPLLPCTAGEYRLTVQDSGGGADQVVSSGTYTWAPDSLWHSLTLTLIDSRLSPVMTQAHSDTIDVSVWGRSYLFQVISGY